MSHLPHTSDPIEVDGQVYRVHGLADDSGTLGTGQAGYRKWNLEHRCSGGCWVYDSHVFLPNAAGIKDARRRHGI